MKCWCTMPMPGRDRVGAASEGDRPAVDLDRALVGLLHAVEDLHQRGLAGAVLADEGVDGAGRTVMSTSWLATTPGNRLVMPRSSTAGGGGSVLAVGVPSLGHVSHAPARTRTGPGERYRPPGPAVAGHESPAVGTMIAPADDLLLEVVDVGRDVVDETAGHGEAHAVVLQVVDVWKPPLTCRRRRT